MLSLSTSGLTDEITFFVLEHFSVGEKRRQKSVKIFEKRENEHLPGKAYKGNLISQLFLCLWPRVLKRKWGRISL